MRTAVEGAAAGLVRSAGGWIERAARVGWLARAVVYVTMGLLTLSFVAGYGGKIADKDDALTAVHEAPFGTVLLAVTGVGLLGYALWRAIQAVLDPDRHPPGPKTVALRIGYAVSGIVHAALGVQALRLAAGEHAKGGDETRSLTAQLMAAPAGRWLVAAVGICVLGVAVAQFIRAYKASFLRHMDTGAMSANVRRWVERLGRLGYGARGVIFGIIGGYLVIAAMNARPSEAKGLGAALKTLAGQPYGPYLLAAVASGLTAYGVFAVFEARYRRIATS